MFSVMSVRHYVHMGCHVTITCDALDLTVQAPLPVDIRRGTPSHPDPMLMTSGGRRSLYGWQAGGTHPTGMLTSYCWIWLEVRRVGWHQFIPRSIPGIVQLNLRDVKFKQLCSVNYLLQNAHTKLTHIVCNSIPPFWFSAFFWDIVLWRMLSNILGTYTARNKNYCVAY